MLCRQSLPVYNLFMALATNAVCFLMEPDCGFIPSSYRADADEQS